MEVCVVAGGVVFGGGGGGGWELDNLVFSSLSTRTL